MKWFAGILTVAAVLAVTAVVLYRERGDERSIDIEASPEQVWRTLMEFDSYPEWNPMVRRIEGAPTVGGKLRVQVTNNGSQMDFAPTVLALQPAQEFRWVGRVLVPGLMDGEHYFRLEPIGTGTRFTQGERFRGVLVPLVGSAIDVADGFERSNAALRTRVLATIAR